MFEITFSVTKPLDPDLIKNKLGPALEQVGRDWVRMVGEPAAEPTNAIAKRTGTMEHRAGYDLDDSNLFVSLGTVAYGRWVLITGSGIFGPRGAPITPVHAPMMVFPITSRANIDYTGSSKHVEDLTYIHAKSTIGQAPWPNFSRWKPTIQDVIKSFLLSNQ